MALVCYASTGSNTSPYETWAKAATSFATALAQCSANDTLQLDMANVASADNDIGANVWTVPANVTIHVGTQSGASGITTGVMGTTYWIGNDTTAATLRLRCSGPARIIGGLTMRNAGSGQLFLNDAAPGSLVADTMRLWNSDTSAGGFVTIGHLESHTHVGKLTLDINDSSPVWACNLGGYCVFDEFYLQQAAKSGGIFDSVTSCEMYIHGGDLSAQGSSGVLGDDYTSGCAQIYIENTILPTSFVALATQTNGSHAGVRMTLRDCSSNGSSVPFVYADALGEIRIDTGIYLTAGISGSSWKITTTSNCSANNPFSSPWIAEYKTSGSVEPKFEVLRDGSTTAYTDSQFWMETMAKVTSSSVKATLHTTQGTGTDIPTGAGLGSWTGESGTAWSGEITQGSITLDSAGYVKSRIIAAVASSTIYVDPGAMG